MITECYTHLKIQSFRAGIHKYEGPFSIHLSGSGLPHSGQLHKFAFTCELRFSLHLHSMHQICAVSSSIRGHTGLFVFVFLHFLATVNKVMLRMSETVFLSWDIKCFWHVPRSGIAGLQSEAAACSLLRASHIVFRVAAPVCSPASSQ